MTRTLDLREARSEIFEQHLGTRFAAGEVTFVLVEVVRLGTRPGAPRVEPFSLTFTGPPGLMQGTYALEHPALGLADLFLVPIGPGNDGLVRYEAVFN